VCPHARCSTRSTFIRSNDSLDVLTCTVPPLRAGLCRCKFLTEGSTPRRGRRVLPVTLGRHHEPFESAGTARGLSALDLVGALHALWRAERRGAREKGVDQDGRTIRDWHHQRVQSRQRGLEWVRVLRNVSRAARGHVPHMHGILQGEIRWRPPNWGSRVRAPLVPDGAAPRTQQQGHPSAMEAVGARNATFHHEGRCLPPLARKPHGPRSARARAEGPGRVWVGPLSGQGVSNAYQPPRNAISAFWRSRPNLVPQYSVPVGRVPSRAARRGRRSPDIHSGLVEAAFVPIWARSYAVPTGLLEGWYPANTVRSLSRTRAQGVLGESGRAA